MGRPSHSPIWPFLIVVAFLFLLSIIAPREWEQLGRRKPVTSTAAQSELATADYPRAPEPASRERESVPSAAPQPALAPAAEPETTPAEFAEYCEAGDAETVHQPVVAQERTVETAPAGDRDPTAEVASQPVTAESSGPADRVAEQPVEKIENVLRAQPQPETEPVAEVATSADAVTETQSAADAEEPTAIAHDDPEAPGFKWATPTDLQRRLDLLACECQCTHWACQVGQLVE